MQAQTVPPVNAATASKVLKSVSVVIVMVSIAILITALAFHVFHRAKDEPDVFTEQTESSYSTKRLFNVLAIGSAIALAIGTVVILTAPRLDNVVIGQSEAAFADDQALNSRLDRVLIGQYERAFADDLTLDTVCSVANDNGEHNVVIYEKIDQKSANGTLILLKCTDNFTFADVVKGIRVFFGGLIIVSNLCLGKDEKYYGEAFGLPLTDMKLSEEKRNIMVGELQSFMNSEFSNSRFVACPPEVIETRAATWEHLHSLALPCVTSFRSIPRTQRHRWRNENFDNNGRIMRVYCPKKTLLPSFYKFIAIKIDAIKAKGLLKRNQDFVCKKKDGVYSVKLLDPFPSPIVETAVSIGLEGADNQQI